MRSSALLLIGTATIAISTPSYAQSTQEQVAQEANQPQVAQASGADIIVTATKRASTIQEVPFSVNAQTQEDIQRANAQTIEDISRNVAGLTVQNLGPGQSQVSVRGVSAGQIVRDQPGVKEQVGIYLDESVISLSLFTPDLDLFDLNRVETLRGPQGTLFGSGSVGGTVRYITNQPKIGVLEGLAEGNVNFVKDGELGYSLKGAVNLPISDTLAARAVAYHTSYGGFIDAVGPAGGDNVNDGSRTGGRLAVLWEPSSNVRITPRIVYQKVTTDGFNREEFYSLYDNQFTTTGGDLIGKRKQYLLLREDFRDKTIIGDLTGSVDFGGVELTSITSYINRDILVSRDASALTGSVTVSFSGADPALAQFADLPSNLRDTTKLKQWTQEARLASTGSGPFQWVVGGFYSHVDRKYEQRLPTPGYDANVVNPFFDALCVPDDPATPLVDESSSCKDGPTQTPLTSVDVANGFPLDSPYNADLPYIIKQSALFGEASYDFGQFKLTAGGRYYNFKEKRDFISGGAFANGDTRLGDKTNSSGFNPRVIATYEPNENLSFNVQAAKGFRVGGINDPLNLPICSTDDRAIYGPFTSATYDDETLWNYEAGMKYSQRGVTFNAAIFHTNIKDLQVTVDAGSCSSRLVFNVPKAHTTGFEAEFAASPMDGLDLSLAGSYVSAEFDSTIDNPVLASRTGIREGNRLPTVPKFQVAAAATYTNRFSDNADWYVNTTFQHVGDRITQPGDQEPGAGIFVSGVNGSLWFDPVTGLASSPAGENADFHSRLDLPAYNLVNFSVGVKWDSGLEVVGYINNAFDANPKLSFDRERGGRARLGYNIGTPRTIGLTIRQAFRSAPAIAAAPPPPPPPPPATQTCSDGSVIAADAVCPPPPAPPPPQPAPERG